MLHLQADPGITLTGCKQYPETWTCLIPDCSFIGGRNLAGAAFHAHRHRRFIDGLLLGVNATQVEIAGVLASYPKCSRGQVLSSSMLVPLRRETSQELSDVIPPLDHLPVYRR